MVGRPTHESEAGQLQHGRPDGPVSRQDSGIQTLSLHVDLLRFPPPGL
jgi:hypothetical protein